jgi:hypothetical protein
MKVPITLLLVLATAWSLTTVSSAAARDDEYQEVEVEDLLRNPQNYWALGIVFRDTLLGGPARKALKIGSGRYYAFPTERLENCYADEKLVPRLEVLPTDKEYIFSGTVLQRSRRYYVVVKDLQPASIGDDVTEDLVKRLGRAGDPTTAERVAAIIEAAEKALFAFVLENKLQGQPLLTPDAKHRKEALGVIRATVADAEREYELTARELLTQFIEMVLVEAALKQGDARADDTSAVDAGDTSPPQTRERGRGVQDAVAWGTEPEPAEPPDLIAPGYRLKLLPYNTKVLGGSGPEPETLEPDETMDTREFTIQELPADTGSTNRREPDIVVDAWVDIDEEEAEAPLVPSLRTPRLVIEPEGHGTRVNDTGAPIGW